MGLNPLYDYLPLNPLVTVPVSELCASTGKWYYEVASTSGAIVAFNADGYDDVKFTNTLNTSVYSAQIAFNVVPGRTYVIDYDLWAKTNTGNVLCEVRDCVAGTIYVNTGSASTGHRTVTFTVPVTASTKARVKFFATKTVPASSADMTLSKINIKGYGLEFEAFLPAARVAQNKGKKRYELANHLGNVLNVVTDRKIPVPAGTIPNQTVASYTADVVSYSDYYPFGQALPYRNGNTPEYRYGFNGMEKDDELKLSAGTSYDFGARMYDPRVGRWLSLDPGFKAYPSISPYVFAINSPNWFIDPNGKWVVEIGKNAQGKYELVFIAEEGDNLEILAMQLGLEPEVLVKAHPELEGLSICEADRLTLSNLEVVREINNGINFIGDNQYGTNCSALADNCDGGSALSKSENEYGGGVDKYETKLKDEYTEILDEKDARIGDVITYRLTSGWKDGEIEAIRKKNQAFLSSMEDPSKLEKTLFASTLLIFEKERHFSVVVLKDKSGQKVQSIIQKNGTSEFDFKVDNASDLTVPDAGANTDLQYEATPVNGKTSPIYRSKSN